MVFSSVPDFIFVMFCVHDGKYMFVEISESCSANKTNVTFSGYVEHCVLILSSKQSLYLLSNLVKESTVFFLTVYKLYLLSIDDLI